MCGSRAAATQTVATADATEGFEGSRCPLHVIVQNREKAAAVCERDFPIFLECVCPKPVLANDRYQSACRYRADDRWRLQVEKLRVPQKQSLRHLEQQQQHYADRQQASAQAHVLQPACNISRLVRTVMYTPLAYIIDPKIPSGLLACLCYNNISHSYFIACILSDLHRARPLPDLDGAAQAFVAEIEPKVHLHAHHRQNETSKRA
jgi:hypothetical protein